jgi:TolA-binding protein
MNKRFLFVFLSIFISMLQPPPLLSGQIILQSDEQFQFARQYMEKGEYRRAVGEFERFIHFFPQDNKVPEARYLIAVCYLEGKEYESARDVLERVYMNYSKTPVAEKSLFLIGESYYRQGVLGEAERYLRKLLDGHSAPALKNAAIYRLGWSRVQENRWVEASEIFKTVDKSSSLYASSQDLAEKSLEGEYLPRKDPTAAGFMAAVLPGLGHAYCHRYKDGLVAFLLNGLFVWAAVESFDEDLDVLGGILAFLEVGWYSGNIYSAVNSAHKYNRKVGNEFRRNLPDRLKLHFFTSRDVHLGLALKINF